MVVMNVGENESLAYRNSKHVLPTPGKVKKQEKNGIEGKKEVQTNSH